MRAEAVRGAKFGALVAGGIMGVTTLVGVPIALIVEPPAGAMELAKNLGGAADGILLSALYGAIIGAAMMGLRACVRPTIPENDSRTRSKAEDVRSAVK